MKQVTRIIQGKLVIGELIKTKEAPKTTSVRPKPSKPVYTSKLPPSLEKE